MKQSCTSVAKLKEPTTYEKQVELLKSRNLIINDECKAMSILQQVNYYRLSAYMLSLKRDDMFFEGVTFEDICSLYEFDKELRNLLMNMLETIEVSFRTHIAYTLAHKYGPLGYLALNNFENSNYHEQFICEFEKEIERNSDQLFVQHHKQNYDGKFPIWVAIELISFGSLSRLFSNLKNEDKSEIAKKYYGIPYPYIKNWLWLLSYTRNICAHYGRLYNRKFKVEAKFDDKDKNLKIVNNRVFSSVYIMKKLCLNEDSWSLFKLRLSKLISSSTTVDLNLIGFPKNWNKLL